MKHPQVLSIFFMLILVGLKCVNGFLNRCETCNASIAVAGLSSFIAFNEDLPILFDLYNGLLSDKDADFVALVSQDGCPVSGTEAFLSDSITEGYVVLTGLEPEIPAGSDVVIALFHDTLSTTHSNNNEIRSCNGDQLEVLATTIATSIDDASVLAGGAGFMMHVGEYTDIKTKDQISQLAGEEVLHQKIGSRVAYQKPCEDSPFKGTTSITLEVWFNADPQEFWGNPSKSCCHIFMSTFTSDADTWEKLWIGLSDQGILDFQTPSSLGGECANARTSFEEGDFLNPMGEWRHIAGVYDSENQTKKLYINGQLIKTWNCEGSLGDMDIPQLELGLGREGWADAYLDEARVWSVARSQEEILETLNRKLLPHEIEDVLFYYDFDTPTSNGILYDKSLYRHHISMGGIDERSAQEDPTQRRYGKFFGSTAPIKGGDHVIQMLSNEPLALANSTKVFNLNPAKGLANDVTLETIPEDIFIFVDDVIQLSSGDIVNINENLTVIPREGFKGAATLKYTFVVNSVTFNLYVLFDIRENTRPVVGGAGQMLMCDGVDDFAYSKDFILRAINGTNGEFGSESYTVEFWSYIAATAQKRPAVFTFGNDDVANNWCGHPDDGTDKGQFCIGRSNVWLGDNMMVQLGWKPPNDGKIERNIHDSWTSWTHWAFSVPGVEIDLENTDNSKALKVFKNGELFAEGINSWSIGDHIGAFICTFPPYNIEDFHYRGYLDEFRIWKGARNEEQIKQYLHKRVSNSDLNDLIAYWDFDAASMQYNNLQLVGGVPDSVTFDFEDINTIPDKSGNDRNLELGGCVPPVSPYCIPGYNCGDHLIQHGVPCYNDDETTQKYIPEMRPSLLRSTAPIGGDVPSIEINMGEHAEILLQGIDPDSVLGNGEGSVNHLAHQVDLVQNIWVIIKSLPERGTLNVILSTSGHRELSVGENVLISETIVYIPEPDLGGRNADSFEYSVFDGLLESENSAVVNINVKCTPGYRLDEVNGNCLKCDSGSFSADSSYASACSLCAPGTAQAESGQIQCDTCDFGYFQLETGQSECNACLDFDSPEDVCPPNGHVAGGAVFVAISSAGSLVGLGCLAAIVFGLTLKNAVRGWEALYLFINMFGICCLTAATIVMSLFLTSGVFCSAVVVLLIIGFHFAITLISVNNYRIHKLFNNYTLRRISFSVQRVLMLTFIPLFVDLAILCAWLLIFPFSVKSEFEHICKSDGLFNFGILILVLKLPIFMLSNYVSRMTRAVPGMFNQSTMLAIISNTALFGIVLSVLLQTVVGEGSSGMTIIAVATGIVAFLCLGFTAPTLYHRFVSKEARMISKIEKTSKSTGFYSSAESSTVNMSSSASHSRDEASFLKLESVLKEVRESERQLAEKRKKLLEMQESNFLHTMNKDNQRN